MVASDDGYRRIENRRSSAQLLLFFCSCTFISDPDRCDLLQSSDCHGPWTVHVHMYLLFPNAVSFRTYVIINLTDTLRMRIGISM
jgi:hypothetical protein